MPTRFKICEGCTRWSGPQSRQTYTPHGARIQIPTGFGTCTKPPAWSLKPNSPSAESGKTHALQTCVHFNPIYAPQPLPPKRHKSPEREERFEPGEEW